MLPDEDEEAQNNQPKQNSSDPAVVQQLILQNFESKYGKKVFKDIEKDLKKMIKKGAGNRIPGYTKELGIQFLVESAEQNYSLKEILREIAEKPIQVRDDAIDRAREFHNIINALSNKLGDYGLEAAAMSTNLLNREPKFTHPESKNRVSNSKRAYQVSKEQMKKDQFNPFKDPELAKVQTEIDHAADQKEAYEIFIRYAGNPGGKYIEEQSIPNADPQLFKNKLKHMARVVRDHPELQNMLGDMKVKAKDALTVMSAGRTNGGTNRADMTYNSMIDKTGMEAEIVREKARRRIKFKNQMIGDLNHAGTHELGHVLGSLLVQGKTPEERKESAKRHDVEDDIIKNVLTSKGILTEEEQNDPENGLRYHQKEGFHYKENGVKSLHHKGQLDLMNSKVVTDKNLTSKYGKENAAEFFAEAFHDVYTHGAEARQTSVEIVKEYERRMTDRQRQQITNKPERSLLRKIFDWFKFL